MLGWSARCPSPGLLRVSALHPGGVRWYARAQPQGGPTRQVPVNVNLWRPNRRPPADPTPVTHDKSTYVYRPSRPFGPFDDPEVPKPAQEAPGSASDVEGWKHYYGAVDDPREMENGVGFEVRPLHSNTVLQYLQHKLGTTDRPSIEALEEAARSARIAFRTDPEVPQTPDRPSEDTTAARLRLAQLQA
eukprot:RCo049097